MIVYLIYNAVNHFGNRVPENLRKSRIVYLPNICRGQSQPLQSFMPQAGRDFCSIACSRAQHLVTPGPITKTKMVFGTSMLIPRLKSPLPSRRKLRIKACCSLRHSFITNASFTDMQITSSTPCCLNVGVSWLYRGK